MRDDRPSSGAPAPIIRRPIRLGLIGTGLAARKLHWPALAQMQDRFELTAFANRTRATAEEFAALAGVAMAGYSPDYRDLLNRQDVDAVLVGVPIPQLLPIARDCLAAGKHLICEKPPGASESEAYEFAELVDQYPRQQVLMAEQVFYRDEWRLARSLIDSGAIGKPRILREQVLKREIPEPGRFSSTPWRLRPDYRGGSILDGGVHNIGHTRLLGGDYASLSARTEWLNTAIDAPSVVTMHFGFAAGWTGDCFYGSFSNPLPTEHSETQVYGTEGSIIVSWANLKVFRSDGSVEEHVFEHSNPFYNEFLNFYEAVVSDEPIVGTVAQSVKNMLIVLRALDSAEHGETLDLREEHWNVPATGVPLWRPRGAEGLFTGLPVRVTSTTR